MARGEGNSKAKMSEEKKEPTKAEIARASVKKAKYLSTKAFINQLEVYRLIKEFFTAYVEKKAEFTYGELIDELHKVYISPNLRTKVYNLMNDLERVEYDDATYSQEELKEMLYGFEKMVKMLIIEHKQRIPLLTRFANWLFRKNQNLQQDYFSELPMIENNDNNNVGFRVIIEDIYLALEEGNKKKAAKYYKKASSLYNHLAEERQQIYYHLLKEAYEKITLS